jgi:hypothetical protein
MVVDGGAALNLISLAAFKKLEILMFKVAPSHPFSGVGLGSVMPRGSISLPVTFGTPENYARRVSSLTSQRLTSPSMPSWVGLPCTSSLLLPTTATWS